MKQLKRSTILSLFFTSSIFGRVSADVQLTFVSPKFNKSRGEHPTLISLFAEKSISPSTQYGVSISPVSPNIGSVSVVAGGMRSPCNFIRRKVFVEEQGVPSEIEMDSQDESAIHVLAVDEKQRPCGAARLLIEAVVATDNSREKDMSKNQNTFVGKIGRVSVLPDYRKKGIGSEIIRFSVNHLRSLGCCKAKLGAQTHAIPFYENLGFVVIKGSGEYMAAGGVPHRDMEQALL